MILDLFHDFRDGSRLLDLLEVMSGQRLVSSPHTGSTLRRPPDPPPPHLCRQSRERGRGMFQHRSNIEKGLSFLKAKSVRDALTVVIHHTGNLIFPPHAHAASSFSDQTGQHKHS